MLAFQNVPPNERVDDDPVALISKIVHRSGDDRDSKQRSIRHYALPIEVVEEHLATEDEQQYGAPVNETTKVCETTFVAEK